MKKVKVVGAMIVKENHVLIAQRKSGEFDSLWEFPGGKIEDGETPQIALKREIMEEFNAVIEVHDFITKVEFQYPNFFLDMDCFICSLHSDYILNEHSAVKWLELNTPVNEVDWVPADIDAYVKLQSFTVKSSYKL